MKRLFSCLFFGVLCSTLFSQNFWTLEECIDHALRNNIMIRQQELNTQIYLNNYEMSKAQLFPSFNAGGNQNFTFGRSVDPFTNEFATENVSSVNFSVGSSVTLFSGFQKQNNIKRNKLDHKAGVLDLEQTKNNITLMIASAFLNVLYNIELLEIAENQVEITQQQLDRTIKLVVSGSLPLQSQYEIEGQLANEELNVVNLKNSLDAALLNLAQILELERVDDFNIRIPDTDAIQVESTLLSIDQIYREALNRMPQVESAEHRTESAYMGLQMAKGARMPSLSLSASYGTGYSNARKILDYMEIGDPVLSGFRKIEGGEYVFDVYQFSYDYSYKTRPFNDQIRDNASASVSLGLTIPIFNGWQTKTAVANSKIQYQQAQLQNLQVKKDLLKDIQQAHGDASAAYKQYNATQKTLEAMKLSFEYTEQRFSLGLINSVDYNISKNNLVRAQSELARAKYDFIFKQKIIDFYRGIPIKL